MVNLYCDNYKTCNSFVYDQGDDRRTEEVARARGWHIFHGYNLGGSHHDATLCGHCANSRRRDLKPAPGVQSGQLTLFSVNTTTEGT